MRCKITSNIEELSEFSQRVGNIAFYPGQTIASILLDNSEKLIGFAAVNRAWHAAGSYVEPAYRGQSLTRVMRATLEDEMRSRLIPYYFSIPNTEFEQKLFAKYGPVSERIVQVKGL